MWGPRLPAVIAAVVAWASFAACSGADPGAATATDAGAGADAQADSSAPPIDGVPITDAGCDATVDDDPKNCGACGHDCLGAACSGGKCQPELFTTAAGGAPVSLVVTAQDVFFVVENVEIRKAPRQGTLPATSTTFVTAANVQALALANGTVYWTISPDTPVIASKAADGSGGTTSRDLPAGTRPGAIAVDGVDAYFCDAPANKLLHVVLTNSATPDTIASAVFPTGVALSGGTLFFAANGESTIYSRPVAVDAKTPIDQGSGLTDPTHVAVDDAWVYYTEMSAGRVSKKKKDGTGAREIVATASGQLPIGVAVDATHVYWTEYNSKKIWRVAK